MRDQQQRGATLEHAPDACHRSSREPQVTDVQCFVQQEQVRLQGAEEREGQPQEHARRVELHGPVEEATQLREGLDVGHPLGGVLRREIEQAGGLLHVLPTGQLGTETAADVQERYCPPAHLEPTGAGVQRANQQFQQGALARAVGTDDPQSFAAAKLEGDLPQGPELPVAGARRQSEPVGQTVRGSGVQLEALAQPFGLDDNLAVQSWSRSSARRRPRSADPSMLATPPQLSIANHTQAAGSSPYRKTARVACRKG